MDHFRDPVHGFIEVSLDEKRIIDSAPFQRLRNIKQLALTHYVYHGAEHSRFGHSLGVMHLATRAFRSALSKEGCYRFIDSDAQNELHKEWLLQILRLIALTHDLGHAPFSHAGELFPFKDAKNEKRYEHEDLTEAIVKSEPIAGIIREIGYKFKERFGEPYDITPDLICDIYRRRTPGEKGEFLFLSALMDSELDCDKMDYLLRDSLYCGVAYGKFDLERLLSKLIVLKRPDTEEPSLCILKGGISAFEEFVLARYFMFVQVCFNGTRRFFDIMLSKALNQCLPDGVFPIDVEEYLRWDDGKVFSLFKANRGTCESARLILDRKSWKCICETKIHPRSDGKELLKLREQLLKNRFRDGFHELFLLDLRANKGIYKLSPKRYVLNDDEAVAIVDEKNGKFTTICDESVIIDSMMGIDINIQRIFASEDVEAEAKAIINISEGA